MRFMAAFVYVMRNNVEMKDFCDENARGACVI